MRDEWEAQYGRTLQVGYNANQPAHNVRHVTWFLSFSTGWYLRVGEGVPKNTTARQRDTELERDFINLKLLTHKLRPQHPQHQHAKSPHQCKQFYLVIIPAISTFSPINSLSLNGLRMHTYMCVYACVFNTGIVHNELYTHTHTHTHKHSHTICGQQTNGAKSGHCHHTYCDKMGNTLCCSVVTKQDGHTHTQTHTHITIPVIATNWQGCLVTYYIPINWSNRCFTWQRVIAWNNRCFRLLRDKE